MASIAIPRGLGLLRLLHVVILTQPHGCPINFIRNTQLWSKSSSFHCGRTLWIEAEHLKMCLKCQKSKSSTAPPCLTLRAHRLSNKGNCHIVELRMRCQQQWLKPMNHSNHKLLFMMTISPGLAHFLPLYLTGEKEM